MYREVIGALSSVNDRFNNKGINSKVELKVKLMEMSQYIGMDYDTLFDKFKEEYEALPVSSDDSIKNIIEGVLPMILDMMENIKSKDKE